MHITRTAVRPFVLIVIPVLVLSLLGGSFVLLDRTAHAAATSTNKSVPFTKNWTFKSPPPAKVNGGVDRCVLFTLTGTIKYTLTVLKNGNFNWSNQRVVDPTLTVDVVNYDGGKCRGNAWVNHIDFAQYWTGYECSFNPSIGFSAPFGLTVGFWPSCGSRQKAVSSSSYGKSHQRTQYNSGDPVRFGDYIAYYLYPPCYGVYVSTHIYDSYGDDRYASSAREVCLPS